MLALQLSGQVHDSRIARAVRECLTHPSPSVRAVAVVAMETMGLQDRENRIAGFLDDTHEGVRRAAVSYLLVRGPKPVAFARRLLEGDDPALRRYVVDALFERPSEARSALTLAWVDSRIASGDREELSLAARALGAMTGRANVERLRLLLAHPDYEIRRVALISAIRRPARELLDLLLPMLLVPELHHEARLAVAAIGDPALPGLEHLLEGGLGGRAQSMAARTLAQIGSTRAVNELMKLVRSSDIHLRYLGLRGLARVRVRTGRPLLPRDMVHRLFLRELRDYRDSLDPAIALKGHTTPEIRLLAESYRESAERALERAVQALACWYDPEPLVGVLDRLRSQDRDITSPALDYLEHVLPRATFKPVRKIFEQAPLPLDGADADRDPLTVWIETAWKSQDAWLRACAVRASRHVPTLDLSMFPDTDDDPLVKAELAALRAAGPKWFLGPDVATAAAC